MKTSTTQQRVLDLMGDGWELGKYYGVNTSYWIQRGGLERGGRAENLRGGTVRSLLKAGLIKASIPNSFLTKYTLV